MFCPEEPKNFSPNRPQKAIGVIVLNYLLPKILQKCYINVTKGTVFYVVPF